MQRSKKGKDIVPLLQYKNADTFDFLLPMQDRTVSLREMARK